MRRDLARSQSVDMNRPEISLFGLSYRDGCGGAGSHSHTGVVYIDAIEKRQPPAVRGELDTVVGGRTEVTLAQRIADAKSAQNPPWWKVW